MGFGMDLIFMFAILLIALMSQSLVQKHYNQYLQYPNSTGMTGAEAAKLFLEKNGIYDVNIQPTNGILTDFYDPTHKVIRLSKANYYGRSISSVAVACHEVGHAIQHAKNYKMLVIRNKLVPIVNFSSSFSWILIFIGMMLMNMTTIWIGIGLFAVVALFQLITLPVEFNASKRALNFFRDGNCMTLDESYGAKKVLTAAAFTYVAALVTSILYLVRYLLIFGNNDN